MLGVVVLMLLELHGKASANRVDMVDLSNFQGYMTTPEFQDMRNTYGVKAITTKISEGTSFQDPYAKSNIQNAEQAHLFVNGYFFCRYTNVQSAINETNFACQTAKADGLPINSALVADIESSQQARLSMNANQACIDAMQKVVESYGYRFTVYSMSSWGDNHVAWKNIGWIANYPYHVITDRYTKGHGWQWTDNFHFHKSYGSFDVSQLYDNFFTGGLNKNPVISNSDTTHVKVQVQKNSPKSNMNSTQSMTKINNNNNLVENYAQTGKFTANTTLNIRTAPNTSSQIVGSYAPDESLIYDHVYIQNGLVWLRYMSYSGYYHFVCAGVMGGESYGTRTIISNQYAKTYTVHTGDTLGNIARKLGVSLSYLCQKNNISNPNLIYSGQVLRY